MTKQPYTFASALKVYIAELRARRHKRRSAGSDAWFLRRYLLDPATNPFMDRPIAAVTDTDIADFLRSLSDRPALAHRCTRKIRAFFAWAMRPARRQKFGLRCSPAANIMPPGRPRQNVLDEEELRAYLAAAETLGPPRGTLAEGLALTGLPPSLIGRMRWSELDLDRKTWTVPKGHACPVVFALSQAFAVRLAEMRAGPAGAGEFVFSADGGRTPLVHLGRMRSELGRQMGSGPGHAEDPPPAWRWMDLRRTVLLMLLEDGLGFDDALRTVGLNPPDRKASQWRRVYRDTKTIRDALERHAAALDEIRRNAPATLRPTRR